MALPARTVAVVRDKNLDAFIEERLGQPGFGEDTEIYTEQILAELCNRGLIPSAR